MQNVMKTIKFSANAVINQKHNPVTSCIFFLQLVLISDLPLALHLFQILLYSLDPTLQHLPCQASSTLKPEFRSITQPERRAVFLR